MFILCLYNRIIKCIGDDFFFSLLHNLLKVFIFLLWLWFQLYLLFLLLFALLYKLLYVVCKIHLDKQRRLSSVLTMSITDRKEMLVESLAHVWCQNEVVLVLLICIVNAEPLTSRICESSDDVRLYYFGPFVRLVFFYPEGRPWSVLNPVVVVDALV